MSDSIWGYQPTTGHIVGTDLIGYAVEATDGSIGKVDKHSDDVTSSYLVVDTGVWIFGKHVLLPAGTVKTVDQAERKIYVDLTKEQIKNSPSSTRTSTSVTPAITSRSAATTRTTGASDSRRHSEGGADRRTSGRPSRCRIPGEAAPAAGPGRCRAAAGWLRGSPRRITSE